MRADEESVNLTPVMLSESIAAHVVADASLATGACALARLTRGIKQTNAYADTAYVFDVARIVIPKKSESMSFNNYALHEQFLEASFLQFAIDEPLCGQRPCRIRGENPSSLPL
jgi:hypothetical protein